MGILVRKLYGVIVRWERLDREDARPVPETGAVPPEPAVTPDPPPALVAGELPGSREIRLLGLGWNEADAKSAIITVSGTVAGGLLVLFIGISVILAKHIIMFVLFTILDAILVAIILLAFLSEKSLRPGRRKVVGIIRFTADVVLVFSLILNGMAYVGLVAGIK